jgi:hypothetical protein
MNARALLIFPLFLSGCLGGRYMNPEVKIEGTNNTVWIDGNMEAPGGYEGDVLPELGKGLQLVYRPGQKLPIIQPIPDPGNGDSGNGTEEPEPGDSAGVQTARYKVATATESGDRPERGFSVILIPARFPDPVAAVLRVQGTEHPADEISRNGRNGNRAHIRWYEAYPSGEGEIVFSFGGDLEDLRIRIPETHAAMKDWSL